MEQLDKEVKATLESGTLDQQLSSFVWICTTTHSASTVTVINAVNPAEILASFSVCQTHLLCIASVPGATAKDYEETDDDSALSCGDNASINPELEEKKSNNGDASENSAEGVAKTSKDADDELVGKIKFVS